VGLLFSGEFGEEGCRDSHLVRAAGDGVGDDVPAVTADGECVSGGDRSIREACTRRGSGNCKTSRVASVKVVYEAERVILA
jgi:hypothetical protein